MSEELETTAVEDTTPQATPSGDGSLLGGMEERKSPFAGVFEKGAIDSIPDDYKSAKSWLAFHKDEDALLKGIEYLQTKASKGGYEAPPEGASEEDVQAHEAHVRKILGVPDEASKYEVEMPEGYSMPEDRVELVKNLAFEAKASPKSVNKMLGLISEFERQDANNRRSEQVKELQEYFGGEDGFKEGGAKNIEFAKAMGFDHEHPDMGSLAVRILDSWRQDRAKYTSEDTTPQGTVVPPKSKGQRLEAFVAEKGAILNNQMHPDYKNVMQEWRNLMT